MLWTCCQSQKETTVKSLIGQFVRYLLYCCDNNLPSSTQSWTHSQSHTRSQCQKAVVSSIELITMNINDLSFHI